MPVNRLCRTGWTGLLSLLMMPILTTSLFAQDDGISFRSGERTTEDYSQSLRVGVLNPFDNFDPAASDSQGIYDLMIGNVFETLVTLDSRGQVKPALASLWRMSEDGKAVEMVLRRHIKFHDGTPFNCKAAQRIIGLQSLSRERRGFQAAPTLSSARFEKVSCNGVNSLILKLSEPYQFVIEDFASPQMAIAIPKVINRQDSYVGTGPFRITRLASNMVTLQRFDDYWGRLPLLKDISAYSTNDEAQAILDLQMGKVDALIGLKNPELIRNLADSVSYRSHNDNIQLRYGLRENKVALAFNMRNKLFLKQETRCMFGSLIDRNKINQRLYFDKAKPIYSMQSLFHPRYLDAVVKKTPRSMFDARQAAKRIPKVLLRRGVNFLIKDNIRHRTIAGEVVRALRSVGVKINVVTASDKRYREKFYQTQEFDMVLVDYDTPNFLFHFTESSQLYGIEPQKMLSRIKMVRGKKGRERDPQVMELRYKSLLLVLSSLCWQNYLLQEPLFVLTRGRWGWPNLNQPSPGVRLMDVITIDHSPLQER